MWGLLKVLKNRNFTQEHKILTLLKTKGHASNYELNKIAQRFGQYIHTLRKEGHIIHTYQVTRSHYEYYYYGHKDDESCPQEN